MVIGALGVLDDVTISQPNDRDALRLAALLAGNVAPADIDGHQHG